MNKKGFTLIELAIVLIIIGIILGAIIKGQDLIENARAKKVVAGAREFEIAQWTFYDRKGRYAGDADADGLIGDGDVKTDLTSANWINPPYEGTTGSETNTISVGSYKFYVFFGNDGSSKNIMIICKASDCNTAFSKDELVFVDAIDTSIDGTANGAAGHVRCTDSKPNTVDATKWVGKYTSAPTPAACGTSTKAVVYYFDSNGP